MVEQSPLRVLVYSDNPRTREQVQLALGKRVHPDLPELTYVEIATGPMVIRQMDEGGFDLVILDGEATPTGGMGIAKQLKDEIADCPPVLVLTGRPDDAWLANWSRAEAAVPIRSTRSGWATRWFRCCAHPCSNPKHQTRCRTCPFAARRHSGSVILAILTPRCGAHPHAR